MRGTKINLDQELDQLQNDDRQFSRDIMEQYPQLSNHKVRTVERIFKICSIFVQGLILLVNRNDNFCLTSQKQSNQSGQEEIQKRTQLSNYLSSLTSCSQEKTYILSIVSGILFVLIGLWLISMKYFNRNDIFLKQSVQISFLVLVIIVQVCVFEIYIYRLVSFFWTALLSIQIVLLVEKYIKPLRIGLIAQILSVIYIQIRFQIEHDADPSQILVGLLYLTLLIMQNFTSKVIYRSKLLILQITRNQLHSVRQFYNDLLGLIPQGLTLLDSSQKIIYANSRVTEILQCDEQDIFSILVNLSNNNAKKASTLDGDQSQFLARNLTASINLLGGGAGTGAGGMDASQAIPSIQSKVQMKNHISKKVNEQNTEDQKQTTKFKTIQSNTISSGIQIKNQQSIQSSERGLGQSNLFKGIQYRKKQDQSLNDSPLSIIKHEHSLIQTESIFSIRDLTNEQNNNNNSNNNNNKNENNNNNDDNIKSLNKIKNNIYASQNNIANQTNISHQTNSQYQNKAILSQQSKFGSNGQKSHTYSLKDNNEKQFTLGDNSVVDQVNGSSLQQNKTQRLSNYKTTDSPDIGTNKFSAKSPHASFFGEQLGSPPQPTIRTDSFFVNYGISDRNENSICMNLTTDNMLGNKTNNLDISTFPMQSTERKGILIYGDDRDELIFKEKILDETDSPPKHFTETTRTELILKNNFSADLLGKNGGKNFQNDKKNSVQEIQSINSNRISKLKQQTSLTVQQVQSSDGTIPPNQGIKEFSFGNNIIGTNSTNDQINSPKKNHMTFQNIQSSAALLKRENRPSLEGTLNQQIQFSLQQLKNIEMIGSQQQEKRQSGDSNSSASKMDKLKQIQRNTHKSNQNYIFSSDSQQNSGQNAINVEIDEGQKQQDEDKVKQKMESNLSNFQADMDSSTQNQDMSIFNHKLKDYLSVNTFFEDKDKCLTECRKSIIEKSQMKRNSRLEKAIKTLEVQDLPKYQEEKNQSIFKQQNNSIKLITKQQPPASPSKKDFKKNNCNSLMPEKLDQKKNRKISQDIQALMLSPSSSRIKKENSSSSNKINSQHNIQSTPKQVDSRMSNFNRSKLDNSNITNAFNQIDAESMSLKKYVISQKESKDLAYKSLFQPKIIKKETKVKNILSKLLNLNKQKNNEDSTTEISHSRQISQIGSYANETQSRNEERNYALQLPDNDDADMKSLNAKQRIQQAHSTIPQITRSKTDQFLPYKDDQSNNSALDQKQNADSMNNNNNSNSKRLKSSNDNLFETQNKNAGGVQSQSKYKFKHTTQYQKQKSPTVDGYSKEIIQFQSNRSKLKSMQYQPIKSNIKNENDQSDSIGILNRNKGRKESFFNQFNKEANIGKILSLIRILQVKIIYCSFLLFIFLISSDSLITK